ncbi:MAG: sel1 repeat family protein [Hyphomicrobiaceae bacterium]|nr:sel1 repeat family protein [Hyphomicrobiaceae bacterium]
MRTRAFIRVVALGALIGAGGPAWALDANGGQVDPQAPIGPAAIGAGATALGVGPVPPASIPNVPSVTPVLPVPGAPAIGAYAAPSTQPGIGRSLATPTATPANPGVAVGDAFHVGTRLYYSGKKNEAAEQLRRAAEAGHPIAQWKLGRMYSEGDGVPADKLKAFEYFSQVAKEHGDEAPSSAKAPFVASAFVSLGSYYVSGIENTAIKPNVAKAREIYTYAASFFGDADAQYRLGRLLIDAEGSDRDPRAAVRWLNSAAKKGHPGAMAVLGQVLFTGDEAVPKRSVQGLTWLTIARSRANGAPEDEWIREAQEQAFSVASEQERRQAVQAAQSWIARGGQ